MDERKQRILHAIVQDYIVTAEPVGSRTLARRYLSELSAATIRNEMADLEDMGLLEQPHTSAGRVPSEKGYRFYVDHLLELDDPVLAVAEINSLRNQLTSGVRAMEDIIQQTSHLLSSLTNYVALVSGLSSRQSIFYRLQLVDIGSGQAVAVLVSDGGYVANRTIQVPKGVDQQWLNKVSEYLSKNLRGYSLYQLANKGLADLKARLSGHLENFDFILDLLLELSGEASLERLYMDGTSQILALPDFQTLEKTRNLLSLVEDAKLQQMLVQSFAEDYTEQSEKGGLPKNRGLYVRIGSETSLQEVDYLSLVASPYLRKGRPYGYLGVVGPIRMDYAKVVATVREVSMALSEALESVENN